MGASTRSAVLALLLLCSASVTLGFYLPGVAPTDYKPGDELRAKVEALTSVRTQLPYEYYVLPFCRDGIDMNNQEALNLGEVLRGSRIYNTPYTFEMGHNFNCKILCAKHYTQVCARAPHRATTTTQLVPARPFAFPSTPRAFTILRQQSLDGLCILQGLEASCGGWRGF